MGMGVRTGEGLSLCGGTGIKIHPAPYSKGSLVRDGTSEDISNYWRLLEGRGVKSETLQPLSIPAEGL